MRPRKIVVIGGGPAALSSALYGLRAGHKVVLVERESIGGQIATSPLVENYPAFPKGSGLELSNAMFEQAMAIGAEMEPDEALSVEQKGNRFLVHCQYTDIEADAVILATGAKHRELGIPGEKENVGKGVYYCAVCDSFQVEGKRAIVIGDGNSAVQYANYLAKTAKEVGICTLFDRFFAEKGLVDTLAALPNVHVHHGISSKAIENNGNTLRVLFEGTDSHEKLSLECEGIFVAIGQLPDNERFRNLVDLDEKGYVIADEGMRTRTPGVFAAGDCRKKEVRQVVTAVNDGAIAALSADRYLSALPQS